MSENAAIKILICQGTGGVSMGAKEVEAEFNRVIAEKGVDAVVGKRCDVIKTGCRGLCANDVLVDIITEENGRVTYDFVKPEEVENIINEHIVNKTVLEKRKAKPYYNTFVDQQLRIVMTGCGQINPESLDAYLEEDGFKAVQKCVKEMSPAGVIDEVKKSGLRGRGGGGFPTGMKWSFCAGSPGELKYVICNADEGDPGAFMDRSVLEGDPYCVIEGMMIAGYAIGAVAGYVYVRAEYPLAIERLQMALDVCYEKGYLGKNVMGLGFDFDLRIKKGAGAFVCGEETALMASIEGERGMPRPRPPFPAVKGLWGKPSNINNVETFANVRHIILRGAEWYASLGTETTKGTKIFAVTGKVKHTGLVEVPAGMTVSDVIYKVCGGIANNRKFKAVQAGGPSGGCIPAEILDTPVDYDSLIKAGAMMGSGGLVVMDETTCMVDVARFFLTFTRDESCGKCVPCRIGLKAMLDVLERITTGQGVPSDIDTLLDMGNTIKKASLCGLGQTAPNPILSTIKYFRHEYEAHINEKRCPSNCCKELLLWQVVEEKCVKCGACFKACPVDAIRWEKGQIAFLDQEKCTKCKSCYDACRFMAIE
ncbi:NADP-reducing hydrogenase subunit HndC [Geobacter sp. OR-1]|uniref:NADH-quinone oxidoreductase subunit NuoF n=1 Tax=Geobacter sp. OR-1 TaxID=1266765 RepID=UPI000541FA2F|nr:NADH-quinone oxidoreductase subunit NuoF [Geobacter sp. OR-1]GAM11231.1 NADP-reducing hydrogenase subunit HndC [Geobacter sp. OR-1]